MNQQTLTINNIVIGLKYTDPLRTCIYEITYLGTEHALIKVISYKDIKNPEAPSKEVTRRIGDLLNGLRNQIFTIIN